VRNLSLGEDVTAMATLLVGFVETGLTVTLVAVTQYVVAVKITVALRTFSVILCETLFTDINLFRGAVILLT